jgi:hypothetical protein
MMKQQECPKCGAGQRGYPHATWQGKPVYGCGTFWEHEVLYEGRDCLRNQIAAMKARHERVCPCGCIVSSPVGHPCVKCGDKGPGRHVTVVFMEMAAIIARLKDSKLAIGMCATCRDPTHDDRHCPTCSATLAGIMSYRVTILGKEGELCEAEEGVDVMMRETAACGVSDLRHCESCEYEDECLDKPIKKCKTSGGM